MTAGVRIAGRIEWPTVVLIGGFYIAFLALTWFWNALPMWLAVPLAAYLTALYGGLQHEIIHGHPTPWRRLNEALVWPALLLWVPYGRYRALHLQHHETDQLTDPYDDPESFYMDPAAWGRMRRPVQALYRINNTLAGRLTIGPAVTAVRFWTSEARRLAAAERNVVSAWAWHLPAVAAVMAWTWGVCGIAPWVFIAAFAYPGTALILLRSFAEHRAHDSQSARTVIVETCPVLGLMFLNNNLHAVHHGQPGLAWYKLPAAYRRHRDAVLDGNRHYFFKGYSRQFARYLLTPKEPVAHPLADAGSGPKPHQAVR